MDASLRKSQQSQLLPASQFKTSRRHDANFGSQRSEDVLQDEVGIARRSRFPRFRHRDAVRGLSAVCRAIRVPAFRSPWATYRDNPQCASPPPVSTVPTTDSSR